jgi:hypothetical protein
LSITEIYDASSQHQVRLVSLGHSETNTSRILYITQKGFPGLLGALETICSSPCFHNKPWHSEEHQQAMYHKNVTSHNPQFVDLLGKSESCQAFPTLLQLGTHSSKALPPHISPWNHAEWSTDGTGERRSDHAGGRSQQESSYGSADQPPSVKMKRCRRDTALRPQVTTMSYLIPTPPSLGCDRVFQKGAACNFPSRDYQETFLINKVLRLALAKLSKHQN